MLGTATDIATDVAGDVLGNAEVQDAMKTMAKGTGVDKAGEALFLKMFPKGGQKFLDYLGRKGVNSTDFAIAFMPILLQHAKDEGIEINDDTFTNIDQKTADVVADSVLETLESMQPPIKFGRELFGIKIPGTEKLEKDTVKGKVRDEVKSAIGGLLSTGRMPTGYLQEGLSRGSLYRRRYRRY